MRRVCLVIFILALMVLPTAASEWEAPAVPESGAAWMPRTESGFADSLLEMVQSILPTLRPDVTEALRIGGALVAASIMISLLQFAKSPVTSAANLVGAVCVSAFLLTGSRVLIQLGVSVIEELSEYSKLFFPVITAALAAQGGVSASAAMYIGTTMFSTFLSSILRSVGIPIIYLYLAIATVSSAVEEESLKKLKEQVKQALSWFLKTVLSFFITYMGLTGVVSGTVDASKLKAARAAISAAVPVLGGTLSNASEAILVGAGLAKNAVGIYGIFAMIAVFLSPFLRIGIHYCILRGTAIICGLLDCPKLSELINDYSSAMGLLLGMTGSLCMLELISTICFLKGGT